MYLKSSFFKLSLIVCLTFVGLQSGFAQVFESKVNLHVFVDNREYAKSNRFSQTIFGARLAPEFGVLLDSVNRFRVGVNLLHEFGSPKAINNVSPIAYYQYAGDKWNFYAGVFPRNGLLTDYPRVILRDTLAYYRPNVEGLLAKYGTDDRHFMAWIDWTSRQTDVAREQFLFGLSYKYKYNMFYTTGYTLMFHNAGPAIDIPGDHVQDNGAVNVNVGLDLAEKTGIDSLRIGAGAIMSLERTRSIGGWHKPTGLLVDFAAAYKRVSVKNSFYHGEGHNLMWGDAFYTAKNYNRLDVAWKPIMFKGVEGQFVFSFHFIDKVIDSQQAFALKYNFEWKRPFKKTED